MAQVSKCGPDGCAAPLEGILSPELFRALGDPTRIAILCELAACSGPRRVTEVAGCCTVDLSVVSRHLKTLRAAGIVDAQKEGREVFYRVRTDLLANTLRQIADALDACCPPEVFRPKQTDAAIPTKE